MAKFILAEKKEMTQKFADDGTVIPVTKVVAGPCVVTQLKDDQKDGYIAVQLGFGNKKNIGKSVKGHLKDLGNFQYLREFKISDDENKKLAAGNKLTVNIFQPGDIVKVTGVSKGKGFQGVVKRHGFHGSPATHGHKDQLRMPGSIGATGPAHVFKGQKMPGQMGGNQVTVTNLEIVEVDSKNNEIFIKGAVPGPRNNLLLISGVGDLVIEAEKPVAEVKEEKPADVSAEASAKAEDEKSETKEKSVKEESKPKTEAKPEAVKKEKPVGKPSASPDASQGGKAEPKTEEKTIKEPKTEKPKAEPKEKKSNDKPTDGAGPFVTA